ncbi:MAG: carboxypeptidase regulatory-like domain-containing protein [Acidobacteriota bacterium]|nr:carboxypeptidase regulatory-like domain-containing protein [Acidobacteriota bacterium]
MAAITFLLAIFASFSHAQVCTTAPSGLVAWYAADGNANDISGNGNHGILENGATFAVGQVVQAFSFDGNDDVVSIPHNANQNINGSFSAEAWIFPESLPNLGPRIFDKDDNSNLENRWLLALANDGTNVNSLAVVINNNDLVAPNNSISLNQWNHVAFSYNGASGELKLFINGVQLAARTLSGQTTSVTAPLRIGNDVTNTRQFDGLIDEATVYNRALSAAEIQAIFNAGTAGKCKSIVTAASVTVSGRVLSSRGRGVSRAMVYLTDPDGYARRASTNALGYFRFESTEVGQTYIFSVFSKNYQFAPQVITVNEEIIDLNLTAQDNR